MNDESTSTESETVTRQVWPRKLNRILIGLGVVAFGLIIADRLVDMFRADDMPEIVALADDADSPVLEAAEPVIEDTDDVADVVPSMEDVFGGRLVFVSVSEPLYVLTDDDRRINVGDSIDADTTLAGITGQGVVVDKAGDLLVLRLPDPAE